MGLVKRQLFIILILYISESSGVIDILHDAAKKVWKFYAMLDESNLICSPEATTVGQLFGYDAIVYAKIRDPIHEIRVALQEIENSINSKMKDILFKIVKSTIMAYRSVDTMRIFISSIAADYKTFYQIMLQHGYLPDHSLGNLTSIFSELEANIGIIRKIMTNPKEMLPGKSSLIAAISDYAKVHCDEICNIHQSIDEILVYVYKIAIIAEIQTSVMLPFANLYQCINHEENFENYKKEFKKNYAVFLSTRDFIRKRMAEKMDSSGLLLVTESLRKLYLFFATGWMGMNIDAQAQFQLYFREYAHIMQQNLNLTTGLYIRSCDPTNGLWILNKNYYELYEMTQTTILRYQPVVCAPDFCQNMWQLRTTKCHATYYDERTGCSSPPTDCKNLGSVRACVLKNGPRKLQYLNSTILGFSGTSSQCPENDAYIIDTGKVPDLAYATCGCQCHENHNRISLMVMRSEVYSNEVIIGLRFKRSNDILHIQPRVGKLIASGNIEKYSERWLKIPTDMNTSQIYTAEKTNSIFFLDDVLSPPEFVLTGVRFVEVRRGNVTGLAIETFGVSFDYSSGDLDHNRRIQTSSSGDDPGQPLSFFGETPPDTEKLNTLISTDMKHVKLKLSFIRSDFKLSMLPLFDAIPVTTDPPRALRGIGIFHKSVGVYAGFISLRIYGMSYTPYFQDIRSAHEIEG